MHYLKEKSQVLNLLSQVLILLFPGQGDINFKTCSIILSLELVIWNYIFSPDGTFFHIVCGRASDAESRQKGESAPHFLTP